MFSWYWGSEGFHDQNNNKKTPKIEKLIQIKVKNFSSKSPKNNENASHRVGEGTGNTHHQ